MTELWSGQLLLPALVGLPLLAMIATLLLAGRRLCAAVSVFASLAQLGLIIALFGLLPEAAGPLDRRYALGGWGAPLGIDLYVDGFSALMLGITATLGFFLSAYSSAYFVDPHTAKRFWPLWWLLIAGLNALFLASDAFNVYVTLEIVSLAAVALVAIEGSRAALVAALRYLFVGLVGSLFYLLGVALIYRTYGTLDLAQLSALVQPSAVSWAALALVSTGLVMKTALVPLHFWLPPAHGSAPTPVSAVLSALVVKASFYLLARFWLDTMATANSDYGLQLLGMLGAVAVLWGSWQAFRARRLKLLVAYSTAAQLGYMFLLFPLSIGAHSATGLSGAAVNAVAYLIIAHACAKAAMFLAVGNILYAAGHDEISRLSGLVRLQPLSLLTFAVAGASLIGLPPSGGFIAKWLLLTTAIDSGQWWWVVVILTGGLMAAMYIFRVINLAFTDHADSDKRHTHAAGGSAIRRVPCAMSLCSICIAILAVILGFNAQWILAPLADAAVEQLALVEAL